VAGAIRVGMVHLIPVARLRPDWFARLIPAAAARVNLPLLRKVPVRPCETRP